MNQVNLCLNPCFSGYLVSDFIALERDGGHIVVLILVLVDTWSLTPVPAIRKCEGQNVLILVLVDTWSLTTHFSLQ